MKGYVRIGGSFAFGILIVLGAFYLQSKKVDSSTGQPLVAVAPERQYIESTDSNGDGIKDWEENLSAQVFDAIQTPQSTSNSAEEYVPPTTFTGKFSEAFFQDYLDGKIKNGDSLDKTTLVKNAVAAVEENTKSKTYTLLDIQVVPDSDEAIRAYGNSITEIMLQSPLNNENEMTILARALETSDAQTLEALEPIREMYTKYINDTLLVPTPQSLTAAHLNLLTAYEAIRTDIGAMKQAFTDPLYSLARVKRYADDAVGLYTALKEIKTYLSARGITYAKDEPGAFFYRLNI